jgi:hypothetical protein
VPGDHADLLEAISRRGFLVRAGALGLSAFVAGAVPEAARALAVPPLPIGTTTGSEGTLQAFADTIIPGRKVARTESGRPVVAGAIAGVDPLPGAVETDALALYRHPKVGFEALHPAFLGDLESRALRHGGPFLSLGWDQRVATCIDGLAYDNPTRLVWEAAAAVPFTAFCAAALVPAQTRAKAAGYRVMGLPGKAPNGYRDFSYRRRLAHGRTKHGSLS